MALLLCVGLSACAGGGSLRSSSGEAGPWTLHAALIKTQGYVVGSPLASSGLHLLHGQGGSPEVGALSDSAGWYHVGWNSPRISGITYDPANTDVMFLAGGNGVIRTLDGGRSWKVVTGWEVTEVQDVALDPSRPNEVYLASAYGIWKSDDLGDSWREHHDGIRRRYTQTIEVDASAPGRVLAGSEKGLFVLDPGASSWRLVSRDGLDVLDIQQSRSDSDRWVAVAEEGGIWLSIDGGETWDQQEGTEGMSFYSAAINPFDADGIAATGLDTGVHLTTDGGLTWRRIGSDLGTQHGYELIYDWNVPGRLWFATLEEGVYHTDDEGATWEGAGLDGTMVFDMQFVPSSEKRGAR